MRLLLIFFLTYSLYGAGFWTLSGLDKTNATYIQNKISYIKKETLDEIKNKIETTLKENSIKVNQQDAPTVMLSLEEKEGDEIFYFYIKLEVGEEVKTFRDDGTQTYAITYQATDFVESEEGEIDEVVQDSVDFLLSKFVDQLEEDKE
jgi:hypothetical protein